MLKELLLNYGVLFKVQLEKLEPTCMKKTIYVYLDA